MTSASIHAGKRATYPAYKPSGVEWLGDVPEHWDPVRLRYRARINPSRSELNGMLGDLDVSFVPMEAVHEYGGLTLDQTRPLAEVATGYTYFRDGDVLAAKITPCFENGKGSIADGLVNGIGFGTTELHVLRPCPELDRRFLFYVTISHAFRNFGAAEMYGAGGQKRVPDDFIRDFRQPIPSRDEQKAIAAFLDRETARIDALIEKKRRQIELLQEKRAALISHAVTKGLPAAAAAQAGLDPNAPMKDSGIEWLGQIPKHWEAKRLKHAIHIRGGQVDPRLEQYGRMILIAPNHIESGTGRVLNPDTAEEQGAISGKYLFRRGDVLYSKIRPELAKACIAPDDGLCSADMYAMVPRRGIVSAFMLYLLLSDAYTKLAVDESMRVAMPKINREDLGEIRWPFPPEPEQAEIVLALETAIAPIGALLVKIQDSIATLQEHRTSLIAAAVTGKIDVRGEVAS